MATNKNFIVKNGLEVDGNTLHVDPDNNRVGIKTNSPSYDLDVNGTSRFVGNVNLDNELIIDNTNSKGLTVTGGDGDTYSHITLSGAGPQKIKFLDTSNAQGLDLVYRTTSDELKIENGSAYTLFSASRDDGSIKLYYGNSLKFQTTNTGVTVPGTALASQLSTGTSGTGINITTNSITGPSTITLDPAGVGDNTGTVVIAGNLQVDGTTTTINSTVVTVRDLNLTLASGAINAAAANNAGIVINGANASLTYVAVKDSLNFNKSVVINNDDNGGHAAYTSSAALRVDGNDGVGLFVTGNEQSADPVAIFYKNDDVFNVPAVIISGDANNGEQSIFDVRGRANQSTADLSATSNSADTIFDVRGDGNVYARGNIYAGGRYGQTNYRVLTVNDEGSGNGLDADLLDGLNTSSTDTSGNSVVTRSSGNFSAGTITASLQARTAVTTWRDHGVSAFTDAPIISRSNTEDNWIYCDIANAQWGIYHRNIDSVLTVSGQPSLPANSIAFVGNNNLTSYIELSTGNIYSIGNVSSNTLTSRVATGTAPLTVSSTTVVTNLNADLLDGWNSTGYVQLTEASTNWNNYHHPGGEYYTTVHGGANNHNNFIHEGFYHVDPTGGSNNPTNTYAYLRVHRHRNTNYGLQIHYPSGDASYFEMRQAYDSSGSRLWTNWFTYPSLERNNTWSGSQLFTGTIGDSPTGTSGVWVGRSGSGDGSIQLVGSTPHIDFANATEDFDMRIIRSGDDVLQVQGGGLHLENDLRLTGASPTIALIDTDHATASLHVNSNIFYILRNAANTAGWAQVDGTWPFEISLTNNDATFGRTVTSNAYQNVVKFKANWRNDNVTALASSYNFMLSGDNDTGSKLVCFINSSTRTADGGANAVTFRNDGGPLNLGSASYQTNIFGATLFDRNNPAISNSSYAVGQNHIELRTTDASNPILGFHRSGHTATALYHAGYGINSLRMRNADGNDGPIFSTFNDGAGSGLDADLLDGLNSATANTASTIVARDASGNFSAGTITAALTGNASTATTLQTTRTIWGQNFNGSANVTGALSSVTTIDASSDISLGGELNFGGTPSGKIIDFYTKNSGGTNFSATMRLVNHDSTSFHNAIVMQRESSVDLYHNNSLRLNTASDGVRILQSSGYWTGFAPQNNYVSASLEGGCYIDFRNELGVPKGSIHNIFFTGGGSELRFYTTATGIARGTDTRTLGFTLWSNGVTNFSQAIHVPQNNNATGGGINFNGAGSTFIRGRNQDGASSTLSNLQLQSWFGIGFGPTISGQTVPQGENAFWINVRDGGWGSRGSGVVGGTLGVNGQTPTAGYEFDVNGDARLSGNLWVSAGNTTGGGIILADDGDIVDLNDSFCSMRFSGGVRIYSANKGGTPAITLANTGAITANYLTVNAQNAAAGEGGEITLAKSSVGSLAGNVIIDVNGDALRIFESNSPFRGVLLNITACGSQSTLWHANNDGAGSGLDADLLDGKNTGTSGNTIPLLDGDNTWSTRQTFSGGIIPGSTSGYPNYESLVEFGADAAGTWKRIINATLQDILYSTIGFKIEITDPKANHAPIATVDSIITETYYVACVRTEGTTTNVPDACYVRGPGNRIRATKTSTGVYQIQIQNEAQYREYRVNISVYAVNGSHAITYHAGDTASAGTAQYNASVSTTSEDIFQNVEARQFMSATTNSNQTYAGQHLVNAPFYNTFTQTGSQYQAIVKGRCTGSTTTDIMSFGNLHYPNGAQSFVFQRIRSDGSNNITYELTGNGGTIWHTANDGAGSGLDADLWDGYQLSIRTNWSTNNAGNIVVGQLSWKNYGNNHTIFDASNGTSPDGGAVNNTNSQVAWSATHPTLMGWNGANTYGVRVDSARLSDSATTLQTARLIGGTSFNGSADITPFRANTLAVVDGGATTASSTTYAARNASSTPQQYKHGLNWEFKNAVVVGGTGNYAGLLTLAPWEGTTGSTGDPNYQMAFTPAGANSTALPIVKLRAGIDTTWGSWGTLPLLEQSNTWSAQQSFTARILMNSAAAERQIAFNNGTTDVYYYGQTNAGGANVGMFDGTNSRHIWWYDPAVNKFTISRQTRFENRVGLDAGLPLIFGGEEFFGGNDTGGADYGYIIWDNDNNTYNTGGAGDSTENGCLRIGTENDGFTVSNDNLALEPTNDLWLYPRGGRVHFHKKNSTSGGQNTFTGLDAPSSASGRGQFVLSSSYSDLVIASSQANNDHGSTLTFATYNPSNAADYRKFVVGQGNWGTRAGFLDFGYSDTNSRANPHSNINATDCVMTLDGYNKRVGIGPSKRSPGSALDVAGEARFNADNAIVSTGTNISDDVWGGSIEIREINQVGNTQTGSPYAPGITFHWANVTASAIKMYNDGSIRFVAQSSTGSSYRPIYANQFISNVATGTAPLVVSSTTVVTNLNADLLDGIDSSRVIFGANSTKVTNTGNINSALPCGFYDINNGTGSPTSGTWHHVINARHNNEGNHYAMQIAGNFFSGSVGDLFYRVIDAGTPTSWLRMWHAGNDGAGSGLDADLLDGINSDGFVQTSPNQSIAGIKVFTGSSQANGVNGPGVYNRSTWSGMSFVGSATKMLGMHYGGGVNELRFGRYALPASASATANWEANPFTFNLDNGNASFSGNMTASGQVQGTSLIGNQISISSTTIDSNISARLSVGGTRSFASFTTGLSLAISSAIQSYTGAATTINTPVGSVYISAPSIASSTNQLAITNSASLYIDGPPVAGINTSLTNRYALYVGTGPSYLSGDVTVGGVLNVDSAIDLKDNDVLRLGSADDWRLYHNETGNYMNLITGNLIVMDNATTRFTFVRTTGRFESGQLTWNHNGSITPPSSGGAVAWNGNAGSGSTDFYNHRASTGPAGSFTFWESQSGSNVGLARIYASGALFIRSTISQNQNVADFAEMFEWEDGNPTNEDRRGKTVIFDEVTGKIRLATDGDIPFGAVSPHPSIVGNGFEEEWSGKYLRNIWGDYETQNFTIYKYEIPELNQQGEPILDDDNNIVYIKQEVYSHLIDNSDSFEFPEDAINTEISTADENGILHEAWVINPNYDPILEYIPRSKRKEWAAIGILGQLLIFKDQPTAPNWIKIKSLNEYIDIWLVR